MFATGAVEDICPAKVNINPVKYLILRPVMRLDISKYIVHYSALMRLGAPIVVGQIGTIVLNMADTLMVGHHSTHELAAASFVNTMFLLALIAAMGFSYGLTALTGSLYGQSRSARIGLLLKNGLAANILVSVVIMLVMTLLYLNIDRLGQPDELLALMRPYFLVNLATLPFIAIFNTFKQFADGITDTRAAMWVIICGNTLNIIGNALLIYGLCGLPEMGLLGAGVATLVSRAVMAAAFVLLFIVKKGYRPYRRGFLVGRVTRTDLRSLFVIGIPLAVQMGMETAAFTMSSIMVGWLGVEALAAHQIMLAISQVFYMVYYGLAAAVSIRVSYFFGQRDLRALRLTSYAGMHVILIVAVCVSVPIILLRDSLGLWFTDSSEVQRLVAALVPPLIVYQFGDCLQCVFANSLRGITYVKPMVMIALVAYVAVSLPLCYVFGFTMGGGIVGIWYSYTSGLTLAGVLYYTFFRRRLARLSMTFAPQA